MALLESGMSYESSGPKTQVIAVEELGGEVNVRGLMLADRLKNDALHRQDVKPIDDETEHEAHARAGANGVSRVLATCVLGASGKPLMAQADWERFGTDHPTTVLYLFNVVHQLSGIGTKAASELEKNSSPNRSDALRSRSPFGWAARFKS